MAKQDGRASVDLNYISLQLQHPSERASRRVAVKSKGLVAKKAGRVLSLAQIVHHKLCVHPIRLSWCRALVASARERHQRDWRGS